MGDTLCDPVAGLTTEIGLVAMGRQKLFLPKSWMISHDRVEKLPKIVCGHRLQASRPGGKRRWRLAGDLPVDLSMTASDMKSARIVAVVSVDVRERVR